MIFLCRDEASVLCMHLYRLSYEVKCPPEKIAKNLQLYLIVQQNNGFVWFQVHVHLIQFHRYVEINERGPVRVTSHRIVKTTAHFLRRKLL